RRVGGAEDETIPVEIDPALAQAPERLSAVLTPLRLRCEFMAELCAAVRAGTAECAETQAFLTAAAAAQVRIRGATDRLVLANQRLVMTLARQYRYAPMAFMDLVQEGNLGLLRAIERFDPDHGARVSTYALWWVRRAMVYAIARQGHAVRPPVQQYWSARQIQRALNRLDGSRGSRSTLREAARELGISVAAIQEGLALLAPAAALDAPMEGSDGLGRIERLAAADSGDPEGNAIERDLRRAVGALLDHLPERHAKILRMRFGIDVHDHCTLEQIAQQQGVTRERIRQLEAQALDALRALDAAWVLRSCLS
ncbi:MAG TPA: sigma-70 family RNA polymerase sigma factor, partial [Gammaproteobacteria bacterium]